MPCDAYVHPQKAKCQLPGFSGSLKTAWPKIPVVPNFSNKKEKNSKSELQLVFKEGLRRQGPTTQSRGRHSAWQDGDQEARPCPGTTAITIHLRVAPGACRTLCAPRLRRLRLVSTCSGLRCPRITAAALRRARGVMQTSVPRAGVGGRWPDRGDFPKDVREGLAHWRSPDFCFWAFCSVPPQHALSNTDHSTTPPSARGRQGAGLELVPNT